LSVGPFLADCGSTGYRDGSRGGGGGGGRRRRAAAATNREHGGN